MKYVLFGMVTKDNDYEKDIYMRPSASIVKVQTANMIALSANMYGQDATGVALGKERGNRTSDDDFDELW
jgi:hypothetical protein